MRENSKRKKRRQILVMSKETRKELEVLWKNKEYEEVETILKYNINVTYEMYTEKELLLFWRFNYWMLTKVLSEYNEKNEYFYMYDHFKLKEVLMRIAWIEDKVLRKNKHLDNKKKIDEK